MLLHCNPYCCCSLTGMYGHIAALARAVKKGVDSVEGMEGVLYQVSNLAAGAPTAGPVQLWSYPVGLGESTSSSSFTQPFHVTQ